MTDEISIPPEAFDPKPWWPSRPSEQVVTEILRFIAKTGSPHRWPGQTYTKPPADAIIVYLAEFDLPDARCAERERWAPCPCCTPRHPKYCRKGKIAYFQNEQVIRIIGPECFKHINEHGHTEALKNYHVEQQRKSDIAYLLNNLGLVPELISAVEHALPVAAAVDELRVAIRTRFDEHFCVRMWDHVRTGELRVTTVRSIPTESRDGTRGNRDITLTETHSNIEGYSMLKPRAKRCENLLSQSLIGLQQLCLDPDFAARVDTLSDQHRQQAARLLGRSINNARFVFDEIRDVKKFTSRTTIATLNRWGKSVGAPLRFAVAFEGTSFYLGRDKNQFLRIEVPPAYQQILPDLPKISIPQVATA